MTLEEIFYDLDRQYGGRFCWRMLPFTDRSFVEELKREIGENHPLWGKQLWAAAKSDTGDRVLYLTEEGDYYIFQLTYSEHNQEGFPVCQRFPGIDEVKEALEQETLKER